MENLISRYKDIPARYPELAGKIAVVTGSSRGIGKSIALRLAREGMGIVLNGRSFDRLNETTAEFRNLGIDVLAVQADMASSTEIESLFTATIKHFGTVDLLVNNAAILQRRHFFDVEASLLDSALAANVRGPYLCAYHAAEIMRQNPDGGNIIHISSVGGLRAHWRGLPYDVTKGALDAMTRAMAIELAAYHIRVNAIAPGATITERTPGADDPRVKAVEQRIPLQRFGTGLEIGAVTAFLASKDASYIIGQILYVDGGITAQLSPPGQDI
ncbi:MAG: glucose 1-dehydrogenase [Anaerolineae bacterium]|nr:glucose 1-dehydrogenase [Anaerolineae bacterium]